MTEAKKISSKVNTLKKQISKELTEIDKDIKDIKKAKKQSVEKIEIKKVELKKFSNTQDVCDEHYATLKEIEQASKLIEERKTSITTLDATIANLDLQIEKIQAEHDKAVVELEKKRKKLNDWLKYYEDLNDKLEKLIQLLGEEEKKHCIELNNLKVQQAKTLKRTDLSENALKKLLDELDNKVDNLNKEHGKLVESISEKISEITVEASSVEELLSDGKKKPPSPAKKKPDKKVPKGGEEGDVDVDKQSVDIKPEEKEEELLSDGKKKPPSPEKKTEEKKEGVGVEEKKKPQKEEVKKEKEVPEKKVTDGNVKEVKVEEPPDVKELVSEGEEPEKSEKQDVKKTVRKDFKQSLSLLREKHQQPLFKQNEMDEEVEVEQKAFLYLNEKSEEEDSEYTSDDSDKMSREKPKKKGKKPKGEKTKKGKGKLKTEDTKVSEEEDDTFDFDDEELLDWFSTHEKKLSKDLRLDLLRQGFQITPSNRIITRDDRVLTLDEANRLGLLDLSAEEELDEEEIESTETDDYSRPKRKKKKKSYEDKDVTYYKSPATSASSSLGKESSESHVCGRDVEYLKVVFGKSLIIALAEINTLQPKDPISYLAHWMLNYRLNQEIDQVTRIRIQELMIEQERLSAEKWHRELQEEARLAVLEAVFRAENIIIQQDFQSELQLHEYEGEFDDYHPQVIV